MESIKLSSSSTRRTLRGSATAMGEREVMARRGSSNRFSRRDPRPAPSRSLPHHDPSWQFFCDEYHKGRGQSARSCAGRLKKGDEQRVGAQMPRHVDIGPTYEASRLEPPRRRLPRDAMDATSRQRSRATILFRTCGTLLSSAHRTSARCSPGKLTQRSDRSGFGRSGSIDAPGRLRDDILRAKY